MKVTLTRELKLLDGTTIKNAPSKDGEEARPLTLRTVATEALVRGFEDEKVAGDEKLRRFRLAQKIQDAGDEIELTTDDVSLVKQLVAKTYPSPLISGQAWEMLEGHNSEGR